MRQGGEEVTEKEQIHLHYESRMYADTNVAINICDNYITQSQQSDRPQSISLGCATGRLKTKPMGQTLTSKPRLVLNVVAEI